MTVNIENMRSEVSIQPSTSEQTPAAATPGAMDVDQLRDSIREIVMEIIGDDVYSMFRLRGM